MAWALGGCEGHGQRSGRNTSRHDGEVKVMDLKSTKQYNAHSIWTTGGEDWIVWRLGSGDIAEIVDIHVDSEHRQQRIGTRLVEMMIQDLPSNVRMIYAFTRLSNEIAHQFYESLGFRILGRLHRIYCDSTVGETAIVFGKEL